MSNAPRGVFSKSEINTARQMAKLMALTEKDSDIKAVWGNLAFMLGEIATTPCNEATILLTE